MAAKTTARARAFLLGTQPVPLAAFALLGVPGCLGSQAKAPPTAETAPAAAPAADAFHAVAGACAGTPARFDFSRAQIDGRTQRTAADGARFAWSGAAFTFHFRGSEFSVALEDSGRNRFGVMLDGVEAPSKLTAFGGRYCYTLASGLSAAEHRITLTRITEASLGESTLRAANAGPNGELLLPESAPARRLEVIGDSITAAYGVEGANKECSFSPATENHSLSYASIAAKALHAQLTSVAWSGKGVFSNRGSTTDTIPMPRLWERTLPERDDSHWDFGSWQPHAVVIELGTNDFAPENPDKSPFKAAYLALVARVREVYPNAAIFCALSPLLSDAWPEGAHARSTVREAIESTVSARGSQGDKRVFYLEHALVTPAEGYGCDWHPSRLTHARMAQELEAALTKNLGW